MLLECNARIFTSFQLSFNSSYFLYSQMSTVFILILAAILHFMCRVAGLFWQLITYALLFCDRKAALFSYFM